MDLFNSIKPVLFKFPDGTHYAMRTTLDVSLAPQMEPGCIYDLDRKINIPVEYFAETERVLLEEYPEEHREESDYYAKLLYGI